MPRSTLALLGTLRELHEAMSGYDWQRLAELVADKKPDLLCVEVDRSVWESGDIEQVAVESREVLSRLSRSGDITLVPIGDGGSSWSDSGVPLPCCGFASSLRKSLSQWLDRITIGLMKLAGGPRAVNSRLVEHVCGLLCELQVALADLEGRRMWQRKNEELLDGIRWILRRDPGRRVLVALDCRRKHWLRRRLRMIPETTIVDFWRF